MFMRLVKIKLGYLISYDYEYFFTSIKYVYDHVDEIFLAIDKDNLTWAGNKFELAEDFYERVEKIDFQNKIFIFKDSFYQSQLTPIQCDTRERELLNKRMGRGWKIQLDSDEYMPDFIPVKKYLLKYWYLTLWPKYTPIMLQGRLINLVKSTENGFFYVDNNEPFAFVTNQNSFSYARINYQIRNFNIDAYCIHHSWARKPSELLIKINNWGHMADFDTKVFLKFLDNINEKNYREFQNFHPISPTAWPKLQYMESENVEDFIIKFKAQRKQVLSSISTGILIGAGLRKIIKPLKSKVNK